MDFNIVKEMKNISREELADICLKSKRIFIYGAGRMGLTVFYGLKDMGIRVASFVVSDKALNVYKEINTEIVGCSEMSFAPDDLLIVAVTSRYRDEVLNNIQQVKGKHLIVQDEYYSRYYPVYKDKVDAVLQEVEWTYYQNTEKSSFEQQFNDIDFCNELFMEKWRRLTRNLDAKSVSNLLLCLYRMTQVKQEEGKLLDIFTSEEKNKRREVCKELSENIVKFADDVWGYRGKLLPRNDFREDIFVEKLGIESITNIRKYEKKDILDVGAYIGDSALVLSEYTKGTVYAFEPVREHIEMIKKTAYLNNSNIVPVELAVGAEIEETALWVGETEYVSGLKELDARKYSVKRMVTKGTIDDYVEKRNLDIGIIKIHAEGCEQEVIQGAIRTIKEQSPILIVEMNHTESDFWNIKPILEEINSKYSFSVYKPHNGLVIHGLKLIAEVV